MHCTFDDAGDGCTVERWGEDDGGVREGELADVRQRSSKREHDNQLVPMRGKWEDKA
jgi:hypothetical protein